MQSIGATRRGLTRQAIVDRALELGDAEGLEAVTLRRLASELGVTPMSLYRHVKDKQDLVNTMYEALVEDFDLKADFRPSMNWANQLRQALMKFIDLHERPVALPLAIAYSGSGSPAIWRLFEDGLGILVGAGFPRREAVALNRMLSIVVAGYLMLVRQHPMPTSDELTVARKRFELELLTLPRAEYPNLVASADELADAQFSDPQQLLKEFVDFTVGGVEARVTKRQRSLQPGRQG
jgi:TetR/AcrR family transcriptional regulator, tetracycline repressor protein